jgi:hypothetical protein
MGASDLTLSPGDILRGVVVRLDDALDACIVDAGAHGTLLVPLAEIPGTTVAKLVPGASVCVQVITSAHGHRPARATVSIEFSGRTSVLVLDGTAICGPEEPAVPKVFVSHKVSSLRRAELATQMESAFADDSSGLPSMLGAVNGPVTVVLRPTAEVVPWPEVVSAVVVQVTEAAAFTVLARLDTAPALLMAEKPDADGDASIGMLAGVVYTAPDEALDGRRITLDCGGEVVFERTEALLAACVRPGGCDQGVALLNHEAAVAMGEALAEYGVHGPVALRLLPDRDGASFDAVLAELRRALAELPETCLYGVPELSLVVVGRA